EAGERMQKQKNDAFEASKNSKHLFALTQTFIDKIGHYQIYDKQYFVDNKATILDNEPFYITSEKFKVPQMFISISNLRPMAKYAEVTVLGTDRRQNGMMLETIKFKYGEYIKSKND